MTTASSEETLHWLHVKQEVEIAAPIGTAFQALLDELGPESRMSDDMPFPMKLEPWPGGRWFRDLGSNTGHLWGHVQVIKPPTLLEICGPLFMSYPAVSHVQYRLKEEGRGTLLTLLHTAMGAIRSDHREGVNEGWGYSLRRVRELAEERAARG